MKNLNNKKGFTLVELLAVIVILALIMSVAVVSMSSVMDSARRSTMKETAASIISGVRQELTINGLLYNDIAQGINYDKGVVYFFSKDMLDKGGDDAPLGGKYSFANSMSQAELAATTGTNTEGPSYKSTITNSKYIKVGNGSIMRLRGEPVMTNSVVTSYKSTPIPCTNAGGTNPLESYVVVKNETTGSARKVYYICLLTGTGNYFMQWAREDQLLGNDSSFITNTAASATNPVVAS